jgi:hypothetical protein
MALKIVTDHRWRGFRYGADVPRSVMKSQFDYLGPEEQDDGFFKYLGTWYHTSEFMRTSVPGWDGALNDGSSSGVLIQLSPDGDGYRVGRFSS